MFSIYAQPNQILIGDTYFDYKLESDYQEC